MAKSVNKSFLLQGYQRTRDWIDENRQKKYITEIVVEDLTLLDAKTSDSTKASASSTAPSQDSSTSKPQSSPPDFDSFDDDIPF